MIQLLIILIVVGAVLYLARLLPIDPTVKTIINVVVIVGLVIWLLRHLSMVGLA